MSMSRYLTPNSASSANRSNAATPRESLTLESALAAATETRFLEIGSSILGRIPHVFRQHFPDRSAVVVTDRQTYKAAGNEVATALRSANCPTLTPFIFDDRELYAEHSFVEQLEASFRRHDAIPVAVGAGTINDLVKLAAHRTGRRYMCVATAASMDGYTAYGASITHEGSKQTFDCPAPIGVVADLDVIASAPPSMLAWGYADLIAKVTAGADWILADFLGIEPIENLPWNIVQDGLKEATAEPEKLRSGDREALAKLVRGLMLSGFAMQSMRSSRPASGAEHQFSHLWDMEQHTHSGAAPSHGEKVGIGTVAVTGLYERLLSGERPPFDPQTAAGNWPSLAERQSRASELFDDVLLQQLAHRELAAKDIGRDELLAQLTDLHAHWDELRQRLRQQLIPLQQLREMLTAVGAPVDSTAIGISPSRLATSFHKAQTIRRRFTVLDLVARAGLMDGY